MRRQAHFESSRQPDRVGGPSIPSQIVFVLETLQRPATTAELVKTIAAMRGMDPRYVHGAVRIALFTLTKFGWLTRDVKSGTYMTVNVVDSTMTAPQRARPLNP